MNGGGEIPYDVTGTVNLKSNISKTREYFSAKLGKYMFLHFLNRMTSLLCQFINFFKGGRVPLKNLMTYPILLVEQPPPDSLKHVEDAEEEAGLKADGTEGVAVAPAVIR